jgi:hypothetical protein
MSAPFVLAAAGAGAFMYMLRRRRPIEAAADPEVPPMYEDPEYRLRTYDDRRHEGKWLGYRSSPGPLTTEEKRIFSEKEVTQTYR